MKLSRKYFTVAYLGSVKKRKIFKANQFLDYKINQNK